MKNIAILGSTGSIGINTLNVVARHPDKFNVTALSCGSNAELLAKQANKFKPKLLAINDASRIKTLRSGLNPKLRELKILGGPQGSEELAKISDASLAVIAVAGSTSLMPLIRAIESKKDIALASKEPLVAAGEIVMKSVRRHKVKLIPVDSEHSAIFQCLIGRDPKELKRIYLTGTGGPLRKVKSSRFDKLPRSRVLAHPKWKMGKKITVDSATLMNKGLEAIEAKGLFGLSHDRIKVLIHPEAIVHSLVEFIDGVLLAQMSVPDMRLPIQFALNFPSRIDSNALKVDLDSLGSLNFHNPDTGKFPCLALAYEVSRKGGSFPAVLNAANEEAVRLYLNGEIKFSSIPKIIERVLSLHRGLDRFSLSDVIGIDNWARNRARETAKGSRC